jgi:hypothetical protein
LDVTRNAGLINADAKIFDVGISSRPADVLIHAFQQERDLAIDVNITRTRGSNDAHIEQLQKAVDRKNTLLVVKLSISISPHLSSTRLEAFTQTQQN